MFTPLPALPYSVPDLRRLCRRITRHTGEVDCAGVRVGVKKVEPFVTTPGWYIGPHLHSYYEAHILLAGGAEALSPIAQRLEAGHVMLHAPHEPHAWGTPDEDTVRLVIWFTTQPALVFPRPSVWPYWPELCWEIALLLHEVDQGEEEEERAQCVSLRMGLLLSRLLRLGRAVGPSGGEEVATGSLVAIVDQFLRDNLTRAVTLADVAAHAGVGTRTLTRLFRRQAGESVLERLFNLRMDHATALLANSEMPLAEIGARVGLSDPSHFCRRFRQRYQVTPGEYRQRHWR